MAGEQVVSLARFTGEIVRAILFFLPICSVFLLFSNCRNIFKHQIYHLKALSEYCGI